MIQISKLLPEAYKATFDFVDKDGNYFYSFKSPKNNYSIGIVNLGEGFYEALFQTETGGDQDTGEDVAVQVLSTVFEVAKEFTEEQQPEQLIITPIKTKGPEDLRRYNVYKRFAKYYVPNGYKVYSSPNVHRWIKN